MKNQKIWIYWTLKCSSCLLSFLPAYYFVYHYPEMPYFKSGSAGMESFERIKLLFFISLCLGLPAWIGSVFLSPWSTPRKLLSIAFYIFLFILQFVPHVIMIFLMILTFVLAPGGPGN
ncbi:MAG: hypothetical protein JJU29_07900 [Verrucomicrobia bacterium]|nr:hypothetical protein [Verrucomicrobiota bacterium]MCH8511951.1 hypothetical protein [Kiritimatiellia bacterium]